MNKFPLGVLPLDAIDTYFTSRNIQHWNEIPNKKKETVNYIGEW